MAFITRQPLAILGALAFISLLGDIITLQETLENIIEAIRSVTRPVWRLLFAWLPFQIPPLVSDYLTMGAILAGMITRMRLYRWNMLKTSRVDFISYRIFMFRIPRIVKGQWARFYFIDIPVRILESLFFWPVSLSVRLIRYIIMSTHEWESQENREVWMKGYRIYFETFIWAVFILAINYALIFGWKS